MLNVNNGRWKSKKPIDQKDYDLRKKGDCFSYLFPKTDFKSSNSSSFLFTMVKKMLQILRCALKTIPKASLLETNKNIKIVCTVLEWPLTKINHTFRCSLFCPAMYIENLVAYNVHNFLFNFRLFLRDKDLLKRNRLKRICFDYFNFYILDLYCNFVAMRKLK